ncbi:MAG: glycosyltransferase family 4 protein [Verrucomicrobia bacterium]|nr:glycosyltransferase family 4 protein [Verrucomicrobiota bacterium]
MVDLAFAATNPCHLYPLAQATTALGVHTTFYSGYPAWRLEEPHPTRLRTHSLRTVVTYGLLRIPERFRPRARTLFVWQDRHFDRWVAGALARHHFVHAIPGQAGEIFRRAKTLGVTTVLNHATGPSRHWVQVMRREYEKAGLSIERATVYDAAFRRREEEEYALADRHCAASTVVRDQLVAFGVRPERIWVVPYGAAPDVFFPASDEGSPGTFRILFAGQVSLRKDLGTLLRALEKVGRPDWALDVFGGVGDEVKAELAGYRGATPLTVHGPVSQRRLADEMRRSSVLVLPSLEEGFGLVVVQALACGTPCVVSDAVGARDLIDIRINGSVFPARAPDALAVELEFWAGQPTRVDGDYSWTGPARALYRLSEHALGSSVASVSAS